MVSFFILAYAKSMQLWDYINWVYTHTHMHARTCTHTHTYTHTTLYYIGKPLKNFSLYQEMTQIVQTHRGLSDQTHPSCGL